MNAEESQSREVPTGGENDSSISSCNSTTSHQPAREEEHEGVSGSGNPIDNGEHQDHPKLEENLTTEQEDSSGIPDRSSATVPPQNINILNNNEDTTASVEDESFSQSPHPGEIAPRDKSTPSVENRQKVEQLELDILDKHSTENSAQEAVAVPGDRVAVNHQLERNIMAEDKVSSSEHPTTSTPGAVAVTGGPSMQQMEQDILEKQRQGTATDSSDVQMRPIDSQSSSKGVSVSVQLSQMEEDVRDKSQSGPQRGAVSDQLSQMEQDVRAKEQVQPMQSIGSSRSVAANLPTEGNLNQMERDIIAKQTEASGGSSFMNSRPDTIAMPTIDGTLNQMEQDLRAKQEIASSRSRIPIVEGTLNQMEQDIRAKQQMVSSRTILPTVEGTLNQMEQDIRAKQQVASSRPILPTVEGTLNQMEQDIRAKQQVASSRPILPTVEGTLYQMEQDIRAKQQVGAAFSSLDATTTTTTAAGALNQIEQDIIAKRPGQSKTSQSGAAAVSVSRQLSQMEQFLRAKEQGLAREVTPSGPVAIAIPIINGQLSQMENDIIAKQQEVLPVSSGSSIPGVLAVPVGVQLGQMERDIMALQQGGSAGSSSSLKPGGVAIPAIEGTLNQMEQDIRAKQQVGSLLPTGALGQMEQDIMAKQHGGTRQPPNSRPGAVAVSPSRQLLSQMEQDVRAKAQGVPGAFSVPAEAHLNQMENDIIAKQQSPPINSPDSRPGAVAVAMGRAVSQMEQDIIAKQQGVSIVSSFGSKPGAIAMPAVDGNLHQMEQDIITKQQGSRPGTTAVATSALGQMEQDILAKKQDISRQPRNFQPGAVAVPSSSRQLSQMEQDIRAKNQGLSMGSRPGAVAVSAVGGQLSQMEQDVRAKQQQTSLHKTDSQPAVATGALSQMERDIIAKQREHPMRSMSSQPSGPVTRVARLSQMEQDLIAKQHAPPSEGRTIGVFGGQQHHASAPLHDLSTGTAIGQLEKDMLAKRRAAGPANATIANSIAQAEYDARQRVVAVAYSEHLTAIENDFIAKQRSNGSTPSQPGAVAVAQLEEDLIAKQRGTTRVPGASHGVSQLERDIILKQRAMPRLAQTTNPNGGAHLSQMEEYIRSKGEGSEQQAAVRNAGATSVSNTRTGNIGISQLSRLERDMRTKQDGRTSERVSSNYGVNNAAAAMSMFEADVAGKNQASSSYSSPAATANAGDGQHSLVGIATTGNSGLQNFEGEIRAKNGVHAYESNQRQQNATAADDDGTTVRDSRDLDNDVYNGAPRSSRADLGLNQQDYNISDHEYNPQQREHVADPPVYNPTPYGYQPEGQGPGIDPYPQPQLNTESEIRSMQQPPIPAPLPTVENDLETDTPLDPTAQLSDDAVGSPSMDGDDGGASRGGIEAYVPPTVLEAAGVAVVMTTEEEERLEYEKRKKWIYGGACCVCLIAIVIIVPTVISATSGAPAEPLALIPTLAPSASPSSTPSGSPTTSAFASFLEDVLKPLDVNNATVFNDVNAPQYRAAEWVVLEDSVTYWPENDLTVDNSTVIQRYALVTFYYATDGDNWRYCGRNSLKNCADQIWLESVDECTWFGVTCDGNGHVEMINFRTAGSAFTGWGNELYGTLPRELSLLTELKRFLVPENSIKGNLDDPFHGLSKLDTLVMSNNRLSGALPAAVLERNPNLGVLSIGENEMTGTIPSVLGASKLSQLNLLQNHFTGTIPDNIGNATRLQILDLQGNNLSGTIPDSLYALSILSIFDMSNNTDLGGVIDTRVGQLSSLSRFMAANTNLGGSVPDELYQLTRLQYLVLSNSSMTGPLTENIRFLNTTLTELSLNDNNFSGPLPTALDFLTNLERLFLNGNSFTGTISDIVCADRGIDPGKLVQLEADCNIEVESNCNDLCS